MITALLAALAAGSAIAEPPASSQPEQRLVCRGGGERQLGTRMRTRRRCMTEERWREEDEARSRVPVGLQTTQGQNDGQAPTQPR